MKRFLVGKRISLHGLTPDMLSTDSPYYSWLEDLSLDVFTERSYFPNNPERMLSFYQQACNNQSLVLLGIFDNESGKHIGNISFQEISWIVRRASIAYLLGDKSFEGKGIVTEAVTMMLYYGFNKLNFQRIFAGVSDLHEASKKVCIKAGLKQEGRLRNDLFRNGEFSDSILYAALRDEWIAEFGEKALQLFEVKPTY
jgi:[ribosomal protein S5]-alanine N-acetyltransferase